MAGTLKHWQRRLAAPAGDTATRDSGFTADTLRQHNLSAPVSRNHKTLWLFFSDLGGFSFIRQLCSQYEWYLAHTTTRPTVANESIAPILVCLDLMGELHGG